MAHATVCPQSTKVYKPLHCHFSREPEHTGRNLGKGAWTMGCEPDLFFSSWQKQQQWELCSQEDSGAGKPAAKIQFLSHPLCHQHIGFNFCKDGLCSQQRKLKIFPWLWNAESRDMSHSDSHFPVGLMVRLWEMTSLHGLVVQWFATGHRCWCSELEICCLT